MSTAEAIKTYAIPINPVTGQLRADWEMDESGSVHGPGKDQSDVASMTQTEAGAELDRLARQHAGTGAPQRIGQRDDSSRPSYRDRHRASLDAGREVDRRARERMEGNSDLTYTAALDAVLADDADLKRRYAGG